LGMFASMFIREIGLFFFVMFLPGFCIKVSE
jgi:hypothetical protein